MEAKLRTCGIMNVERKKLEGRMKSYQLKQHRRLIILSVALLYLAILSLWQNGSGGSIYVLWVAFFAGLVAALIFVHNSNRELKEATRQMPDGDQDDKAINSAGVLA